MSGLLLIYAVVISIELILSIGLLVTLYMIVAPVGSPADEHPVVEPLPRRDMARSPSGALREAFETVARGEDDLARLMHARSMLARYAAARRERVEGGNQG